MQLNVFTELATIRCPATIDISSAAGVSGMSERNPEYGYVSIRNIQVHEISQPVIETSTKQMQGQ